LKNKNIFETPSVNRLNLSLAYTHVSHLFCTVIGQYAYLRCRASVESEVAAFSD